MDGVLHRARLLLPATFVLITAACGSASPASSHAATASWSGAVLQNPLPKPEFVLTDTRGRPYDFRAESAGKVTLLYFGYTHCPDVCPVNMATLATAMADLPASVDDRIAVVFVTTDPARDTPGRLRSWLNQFSKTFVGLSGSPIQIAAAQLQAGLGTSTRQTDGAGGYGIDHAAFIMVYTPDNRAHLAFPAGVSASAEATDLRRLVATGWSGSS